MTSSYRDPNVTAALAYQAEQEQRRKAQEQPSFIDVAGRAALGLGVAALAGAGIARGLRRNAVRPVTVEDLGATAARAEENVRRAARSTATPPPSRPAPPAGVARQQAAEEFTRQARAERPAGIQQVNIKDLGPTWYTPTAAENKATLSWLDNVVLPTEQALTRPRLPGVTQVDLTEFSPQFRSYGQVPQVAEQVVSEVKALPPARAQSTDFLRNQLGSRGYIEQSILDRVAEQSAGDLIDEVTAFSNKEARSELARQGASIQSQERKNLWNLVSEIQNETLVDTQQARTGFNVDQAINALDAAEDQQTGRMKIQLQRNEDLDLGQVEVLEDIASQQPNLIMAEDGPINSVASQLPDGLPVDQAEGVRSLSSQELADVAKADMIARRQEVAARGLIPGTLRFERALAEGWASKPGFMPGTEEFRQRIALPRVIRSAIQAASADPLDPLGGLKERTVVNIGPNAEISSTAAGTAIRGASPVYDVAEPKVATRQIYGAPDALVPGAPDELMFDRPGIETAFQQIISQPQLPERTDPYALKRLKGGSPGIGVYGPELSYVPGAVGKATGEYSAAAGRTPGYVPAWILKQERTPFSETSTEGLNRALAKSGKSGTLAITSELGRREIAKENLVKSELLRRANIEGRDPQMILKQFGIGT
jgi:hypothetical protein